MNTDADAGSGTAVGPGATGDAATPSLPDGYRLRQTTWQDLDVVTALYDAVAAATGTPPRQTREELRYRWRELERFNDALVVEAVTGQVAAFVEFHEDHDPWLERLDVYVEGRVHPDHQGRGIASALLAMAQARAVTAAGTVDPHVRVALRTPLDDADDRARALYERLGFRAVRHFLDLRFDLDEQELPYAPVPKGVHIRRFRPGKDDRAMWEAMQGGFADHWAFTPTEFEEWRYLELERPDNVDPRLWLVAEADDRLVGGAITRIGTPSDPTLGYIKDLAVLPGYRRRGIALALIRVAFRRFRRRGVRRVGLEVDDVTLGGALRLYERAGMRVARRTDVYEQVIQPGTS